MKKYCDEIAEVCHEIVEDGYRSGIISAAEMREFEEDCFVEEQESASKAEGRMNLKPAIITAQR